MEDDSLGLAIQSVLDDVNTCMPGTIVSFDGHYAVVQPSLSKLISDGRVITPPQIVDVPVVFLGGQNWRVSGPLQQGDGVMLHFSQRSLEAWHDNGNGVPDDPRRFSIADAVAVPGLAYQDYYTGPVDTTNLCLFMGTGSFKMTPGGVLQLNFPGGIQITQGDISSQGDIVAKGKSLVSHVHSGVQSGSSNTGAPV